MLSWEYFNENWSLTSWQTLSLSLSFCSIAAEQRIYYAIVLLIWCKSENVFINYINHIHFNCDILCSFCMNWLFVLRCVWIVWIVWIVCMNCEISIVWPSRGFFFMDFSLFLQSVIKFAEVSTTSIWLEYFKKLMTVFKWNGMHQFVPKMKIWI